MTNLRFALLIALSSVVLSAAATTRATDSTTAAVEDEDIAMGKEWLALLRAHPVFSVEEAEHPIEMEFRYAAPEDENLTRLRDTYGLEEIAGQGPELDRIINLMHWVYRLAGHANEPTIPAERNAFTLIQMAREEGKQINCYMKTVILNEVYLALGFPSRQTHLLPYRNEDRESHFVTSVYSRALDRWILMDPDFGAYVTDGAGNVLGVSEVRRRLIEGAPLEIVRPGERDPDNNVERVDYLWFLSAFIFKIRCPIYSEFNQYSRPLKEYYELIPADYRNEMLYGTIVTRRNRKILFVDDETAFWQAPADSPRD
jgi:hypothetical protein